MEYKIFLGYLASSIAILSYLLYFIGIAKGKTKPHAFTWLVWGVLNIVAFAAVLVAGGEAGAWVLGINALACLTISGVGFYQRHVEYDIYDWLALAGALVGAYLWWLTSNPLYAVILVCLSDGVGSVPIFRKAYRAPFEENALAFFVGILYYPLAIVALESLTLTTWLYPAFAIILDGALVSLVLWRRKKIT
ncbi:MAG TPA: hypothetical protein VJH06_03650 [Candidatus Paceibacterota bacterium]